MQVRRYEDPASWLADAMPLIGADEPRHNLMFGIAARLIREVGGAREHRLWLATAADTPRGAMLQTPPYRVVVARPADEDALHSLVDAAIEERDTVPGVHGVRPEVEAFADRWRARTGDTVTPGMVQGIYEARAVRDVPAPAGAPRRATLGEVDVLSGMFDAFADEALAPDAVRDRDHERSILRARLVAEPAVAGVWVWEVDGEIVALTGHDGRTPSGIRIGPVYTPHAHRGRGYATALVHAQTAWLLANAVDVCFLYTDLSNPTSNGVYRRIGYRQVPDATEFAFAR